MIYREHNKLTAVEARKAIDAGDLTSEALISSCLRRIEKRENYLNAWACIDSINAVRYAKKIDINNKKVGLLHGIPIGLKDIINTDNMPTEYGSIIYKNYKPKIEADCVKLIRLAGGIVLGKTVTAEFAAFTPGPTRNPCNLEHTPGGSSSGSAAAVADYMVPLSLGTQTGGSVIRPASYCGIIGFKPTYGEFKFTGIRHFAPTLDTLGFFARTVNDIILLYMALNNEIKNHNKLVKPPCIGLCKTPHWEKADKCSKEAVLNASSQFLKAGAKIIEISLGNDFVKLPKICQTIMSYEGYKSFSYEFDKHKSYLSQKFREKIGIGKEISLYEINRNHKIIFKCKKHLDNIFGQCDVLLVPAVIGEAPSGIESTGNSLFCRYWSVLGTPSITIPAYKGPLGLPVGIQVVGPINTDLNFLSIAQWIEDKLM